MKILSIGLDSSILDKNSNLAKRVLDYGDLVDKYTVIVPSREDVNVMISEKIKAIGSGGKNKITRLIKLRRLAHEILREDKYDVVTVQDQYFLAILAWCLSKKFKLGLEIQVHGFEKFSGLRKRVAKFVIPKADVIRVVSKRLEKYIIDTFKVNPDKITVVPIFVDKDNILKNVQKKEHDKFIFLTASRFVKVKNIAMQIKAVAELSKKFEDIELWLAGSGPEEDSLRKLSKDLGVKDKIKFLGWCDDLDQVYSHADTFLLTSDSEGWGMVVIEASGYGLPIIMTDVGCAGEVIKDGINGIIIPIGSQENLEIAMQRVIEDKELKEKLSKNAKKELENLLTKKQTLDLYKESWVKAIK